MLAVNLREVVGDLEGLADFVRRQEVVASQRRQAADAEGGKAAIIRDPAGCPEFRIAREYLLVVPSGPERVVCRWSNPPRTWLKWLGLKTWVYASDRLVGSCGLIALLERAAVGYAPKMPGMNCGSSTKLKRTEDLIFVIGVEVAARHRRSSRAQTGSGWSL